MKQECTPELPVSIGIIEGWLAIVMALLVLAASIAFVVTDEVDEEDKYMAANVSAPHGIYVPLRGLSLLTLPCPFAVASCLYPYEFAKVLRIRLGSRLLARRRFSASFRRPRCCALPSWRCTRRTRRTSPWTTLRRPRPARR